MIIRKIFSLVAISCICGAFANAHTRNFTLGNAAQTVYGIAQTATLTAGDDQSESLDAKKKKIIDELNGKKSTTKKDVVKAFIDKSIEEIDNAKSAEDVDNISPLILAKVNACLEVEANEKTAFDMLSYTERDMVAKSYTDIINATDQEQVNSLKLKVNDMMDLRISKELDRRTVNAKFNEIPASVKTINDERKIDGYIDEIMDATSQDAEKRAYHAAMDHIEIMEYRSSTITGINTAMLLSEVPTEAQDFVTIIIKNIVNSNDKGSITNHANEALSIINADQDRQNAIIQIHKAMQGEVEKPFFYNLVKSEILEIARTKDMGRIAELRDAAVNKLNATVPAYKAGRDDAVGTLGTPQQGPILEVTDQNDKVIILYNPKSAKLMK